MMMLTGYSFLWTVVPKVCCFNNRNLRLCLKKKMTAIMTANLYSLPDLFGFKVNGVEESIPVTPTVGVRVKSKNMEIEHPYLNKNNPYLTVYFSQSLTHTYVIPKPL